MIERGALLVQGKIPCIVRAGGMKKLWSFRIWIFQERKSEVQRVSVWDSKGGDASGDKHYVCR